jgi:hypothetical protein
MDTYPVHFSGRITWVGIPDFDENGVQNKDIRYALNDATAIQRSDSEIVLDFRDKTSRYTATLVKSNADHFTGEFLARDGAETWRGPVTARAFPDQHGLFLFGTWFENPPPKNTWWAELKRDPQPGAPKSL